MTLPRLLVPFACLALLASPPARAADCAAPPDTWLIGNWGTALTHVRFTREGKEIAWEYRREPGVMTERWGEKATATAKGIVTRVTGCEVEMKGKYTEFGGSPKAVGTSMQYVVTFDGTHSLAGKGLAFGKEWYEVRWFKAQ